MWLRFLEMQKLDFLGNWPVNINIPRIKLPTDIVTYLARVYHFSSPFHKVNIEKYKCTHVLLHSFIFEITSNSK